MMIMFCNRAKHTERSTGRRRRTLPASGFMKDERLHVTALDTNCQPRPSETGAKEEGSRKRAGKRFRRAGIAGLLAVAAATAAGGAMAVPSTAQAAGCAVKGGNWAPVNIRQSPNTSSSVLGSIGYNQVYQSSCSVITGGNYTACSSTGSVENRWIPIVQQGYVAWRCVIGPYGI